MHDVCRRVFEIVEFAVETMTTVDKVTTRISCRDRLWTIFIGTDRFVTGFEEQSRTEVKSTEKLKVDADIVCHEDEECILTAFTSILLGKISVMKESYWGGSRMPFVKSHSFVLKARLPAGLNKSTAR